nr:hypothetical protein [Tanacetum cinerariifolium]
MALSAKLKLGFINCSCLKPASDHEDVQRWIRYDYVVTCWTLNSMVIKLSDAFLYAQSACEIWKRIGERYGQSNGPLIFQLERELSKINQGKEDWKDCCKTQIWFDEHFNRDLPFDMGYENEVRMNQGGNEDSKLVAAVYQEMMKLFKGNGIMEDNGSASTSHAGVSNHMSPNLSLFISTRTLKTLINVHLTNSSSKTVTIVGQVRITPSLILTDVFYLPDF